MQYGKNVLLNGSVLEGKAVSKFLLALQTFRSKIFHNLIKEGHLSVPSSVS